MNSSARLVETVEHHQAEKDADARAPWSKPVLVKLKKPSDAQTGGLIGPDGILVFS